MLTESVGNILPVAESFQLQNPSNYIIPLLL